MPKLSRSANIKKLETSEENLPAEESNEDIDENYSDESFRELQPSELHNGYESSIEDWILRNELQQKSVVARVYKFDGIRKTSKVHCGKFCDEVPDEDEIGRTFGSGRYSVILNATDKNGKRRISEYKFTCADIYDDIKNTPVGYNPAMGLNPNMSLYSGGIGGIGVDKSFDKSMDAMAKMLSMIIPLVKSQGQQVNNNMPEMMAETYKMMSGIMKRSVLDQTQLINDMNRRNAGLDDVAETEEEVTGVAGILQQLKPYVDQLVPLFVGRPNLIQKTQAKATVNAIKQNPQYLEFVKNRRLVSQLCKFIEEKHGKEAVKAVLQNFNISKPRRRVKTSK